jgi:hypothetical protein
MCYLLPLNLLHGFFYKIKALSIANETYLFRNFANFLTAVFVQAMQSRMDGNPLLQSCM